MAEFAWYAVHVRSNQEKVVARHLEGRGLEHFLPTYREVSRRTDRRVVLERPLFGGYIFVRMDVEGRERIEVVGAPGVVRIVGFGGGAMPVPDETIESVRILTGDGGETVRPHPLVKSGRRVVVVDGSFAGASGVLFDRRGKKPNLVVEIEFLGRAVGVPVSEDQVRPVFD